ncbi:MAG: FtsK/SpoIIIE domain-containing protein [Jatrophihabitans sp.]|uniref:FtsK/SpoIIIE domain-containing protein n=1 Tax=Jatrophihabitans sp. TaxID=1932789 RepID=UPI003912F6C2
MQLQFTVDIRGDRHDVALAAPDTATVADIAPALRAAAGAATDVPLWHSGRLLPEDCSITEAGVRTGSLLGLGGPAGERARAAVLELHVVAGPDAGRVTALDRGRLRIGRDPGCEFTLADADVSRQHAVVDVGSHAITLHDLGSTNGTRVDGRPVPATGSELRPGCLISMGDSLLTIAGPLDAPATLQAGPDGSLSVLGSPRRRSSGLDAEIVLPIRPDRSRPRGVQWVTALLPAAAGGAIAWFAHSPQFLLFALLSPLMMVSTALGDRLHWRRSRRRDAATFRQRRAETERRIADGLGRETADRRLVAPDAATVRGAACLPSCRLWERRRRDDDFLDVRLGTADLPSTLQIRDGASVAPAATLTSVPVNVGLRSGPLGVAGPADVVAASLRWLVGQLAVLHSPPDLELALLLDPSRSGDWAWARWLPHVHGRVATTEPTWAALLADLTAALDHRRRQRRVEPGGWPGPWSVLVVDRMSQLSEVPGLAELLADGAAFGITAICAGSEATALPSSCAAVVRVCGDSGTRARLYSEADRAGTAAVLDGVSSPWAETVARALAPLVDAGIAGAAALPDACRLLDLLGLEGEPGEEGGAIERHWARSAGGAATVLGRCADGELEVDLVRDGPHALIAGTTGAGKSELLRALVSGLATNHPPEQMNFLLIDYKGGAAFGDCARLPHTAGLVTDLDPYLTERALRSLHSELRRRERLFAAAGADDLPSYQALAGDEAVARLIIVVDEFASLVDELPDFVRGLVGVAQRGRSLGVHLVLATQRPGRAVSPEIRANTSLRIALRVTDAAESTDVVGAPDAATIHRSVPGRAYLRTGSSLTCFQAASVGGIGHRDTTGVRVERLGPWRRPIEQPVGAEGPTDVSRLVEAIRAAASRTTRRAAPSPWVAPLPDALPRTALDRPPDAAVAVARVDLPDEQRITELTLDLARGSSLLAAGTTRSGRTGLLASLAIGATEQLGPDALNLHVVDATGELASALRALPHAATMLGPDELGLAPRLLHRLEQECSRRLREQQNGGGGADRWSRLLLLVDGWETLAATLGDLDGAGCTEALGALLRIGPAAGVSMAVTGDRSTLAPRFSSGFAERVLLRLPDRSDYGLAGVQARNVPVTLPPGRGMRAGDGAVLQVAHAGSVPGLEGLRRVASAVAARWAAAPAADVCPHAIRIRALPTRVALGDLPRGKGLAIGLAGDRSQPLLLDPFAGAGRMLVAGPPRSGRTTLLRSLAQQACAARLPTVVAASSRSACAEAARSLGLRLITPADDEVGPAPATPTLLLIDDSEAFLDTSAGDRLTTWVRSSDAPVAAVVAGRSDDLATTYRGVAADVRRSHCGILLRPGPVDGELLGVRLPRRPSAGPPGRGVIIGTPAWDPLFDDGDPVPVQVAQP